jgi:hypothetical protein
VLYVLSAMFTGMLLYEIIAILGGGPLPRYWWMLPAGLAYGALLFFIILPWRVAKIFKDQPALGEPMKTVLDDEGLGLQTSRGQVRFKWTMLKRWKRNARYILVYHSAVHFHILPRRSFASEEEFAAALSLLRKNLGEPAA